MKRNAFLSSRNLLRTTRESQLKSVDGSASTFVFIGKQGKEFEFSHLNRSVDVCEAAGQKGDINTVTDWLSRVC